LKSWNTKRLAAAAVIAAAYAALTMAFAAISYESLQFRFSEALCVLPFFFPPATWGLFVGCIIANLISVGSGRHYFRISGNPALMPLYIGNRKRI